MPRMLSAAAIVAVLVGLLAVTAGASRDGGNPPGRGFERVGAPDSVAASALSVMQRPREQGDELPDGVAREMGDHALFGVNPDLSRRATGNATNSVYVVPANGHVCLSVTINEGARLSCTPSGRIAAGIVGGGTIGISDELIAVYGIVPDGVDSVTVHARGLDRGVDVESNVYYAVVPADTPLQSLSYSGPSGRFSSPLSNPRLVFEQR